MLTQVRAGRYTVRGISVGGIYTTLHVKELDVLLDVGLAPRAFAGVKGLFLSHCHADHAGALHTLIGTRMLTCGNRKLRLYAPAQNVDTLRIMIDHISAMQRYEARVELIGLEPGDEVSLHGDMFARAFRTFHPVPSLGYVFFRRVNKLRPEYQGLDGRQIREHRLAGDDIFDTVEHAELAYATDTLPKVLEEEPSLFDVRTLILECTFLDERKSRELAHKSCHVHLDDLLPHADRFNNETLVLMHFSQLYKPSEVHDILAARCPDSMRSRLAVFAPRKGSWPG